MSPGRETPRVLVVDDTPAHIRMLVGALRKEYEILVATNGEQALELARSETPDIILLDIVMPGWCQRSLGNAGVWTGADVTEPPRVSTDLSFAKREARWRVQAGSRGWASSSSTTGR
ncbi:MAG: hypothetical protein DIJKHBIC_00350 [Thermoanaerobaculia bacterium]|nr:hypothetical protein [Thermoanaerobaculia bacterium]